MNFMKTFLRGIAILPSLVQGTETLYGAHCGSQKKDAVEHILGSALNIEEAVCTKQILDEDGFRAGLGKIVDGIVQCFSASIWHKS